MRIIVPYTEIKLGVLDAIDAPVELCDVSGSDSDYWELLSRLWHQAETFCVIEQDIVVKPTTLAELDDCREEWCSVVYPYLGGAYPGLGCARFRAELLQRRPDAVTVAGEWSDNQHSPCHWCVVDHSLTLTLNKMGETKHVHYSGVDHLGGDRPAHGCCG